MENVASQYRPYKVISNEADGLSFCLFLALVAMGFYAPGPGFAEVAALLALIATTATFVATRLRRDGRDIVRGAHTTRWGAALAQRHDFFLGALLLITAHAFVQISGSVGGVVYPLIYMLLLGMGTFQSPSTSIAVVSLAVVLELSLHLLGHPPGLSTSSPNWAVLSLRCVFLGLFGGVYAGLLRVESLRHQRRTDRSIDVSARSRQEATRDYRLVATGKPKTAQAVPREDAEEMLREEAIGTIRDSINETLRLLRSSLGCHSAALLWLDEEGLRFKLQAADSASPDALARTFQPGEGVLAGILRRREVVCLHDIDRQYAGLGYYRPERRVAVRQFMGTPVMERRDIKGILCLDRIDPRPFSEADAEIAKRAASSIVRTVQTERLFLEMEAARYELDRFYEASRQLNSALTSGEVQDVALACARDLCHFDFAAIVMTSEAGGHRQHTVVRVEGDQSWSADLEGLCFGHNAGLVSLAVEMQVALPHSGTYKERQNMVFSAGQALKGMHSLLILPLVAHDRTLGALVLACKEQSVFTPTRREILGVVANQVAISLQNATMYETMELMATTDGLTGLTNHRTFKMKLDEVIARSQRGDVPFTLLLTDVDHFKSVNDNYGHPMGDEVLRQVSETLRRELRQTDIPARYGGEEFIIILEGTDLDGALLIAERLRTQVGALTFGPPESQFSITMSFGVSEYPQDAEEKLPLINVADQALYYAKTHGRNQVRAWRDIRIAPETAGKQ